MTTQQALTRFLKGSQLTRAEIWQSFHPNLGAKPKGGNWDTGYVIEGDELIAFLNIDAACEWRRIGYQCGGVKGSQSVV